MKVPVFLVVTLGEIRGRVTQSQTCHTSALAQWSITVDGWLVPPVGEQYTQDRVTRMEEWGGKKGGRLSLRFTCRCLAWKRHLNHGLVSTNANSKPISRFFYICTGLVRYSTRFHHLISPSYKVWRTMIRRNREVLLSFSTPAVYRAHWVPTVFDVLRLTEPARSS